MQKFLSYKFVKKTVVFAQAHKIMSGILVIVVAYGGYWGVGAVRGEATETRYVLGEVSRGTIISSVSASGQVSTSDQIDIRPKASGDITWVGVKAGDVVRAGQAIATIDSTSARQAIADAEASLAQAKLQFQKDSAQAPIDYEKSLEALEDAKRDLDTTYTDTFNTVSNAYLSLPAVMTGMQDILYGDDLSPYQGSWNISWMENFVSSTHGSERQTIEAFADIAERDYRTAREKYDANLVRYKTLTRYSETSELEVLLTDSLDTTTAVAQGLQSTLNLLDALIDYANKYNRNLDSRVNTLRSNAQGYLSTANSTHSSLLSQDKSLDSAKRSIRDQERSVEIYKIGNSSGANPISLQSSAQSIANQERNIAEMKQDLANYTITAPFAGTIASLSLKRFDSVSTGSSVASLITNQKIATLSLNEVDLAKIKLGSRTTLTFDAVEDLSLTGEVVEIDAVGTVSQGVVSYSLKVAFDTQDERIKPGMTVNASIVSNISQDALIVSASAVRTQGGNTFVQVFDPPLAGETGSQGVLSVTLPQQIPVEIGISDDSNTEIISGLSEGQQIVVRTTSSGTAQSTTQTAPSLLGGSGTRGAGGGTMFISR